MLIYNKLKAIDIVQNVQLLKKKLEHPVWGSQTFINFAENSI